MKVRESGMPDEAYWESLFDVPLIVDRMLGDADVGDVLEVGCGYGTFTIPVAKQIKGTLTALDLDPEMTAHVQQRVLDAGVSNVRVVTADVEHGCGVAPQSQDAVLLFNILHGENPESLLKTASQILRPGGRLCIIHWRYDPATPRGPDLSIRPKPEQIRAWAHSTGPLHLEGNVIDLPPWHYGLLFTARAR